MIASLGAFSQAAPWQQRAEYTMDIDVDADKHQYIGQQEITYYNNSPDNLSYLLVQLDQNVRANESETPLITTNRMSYALDGKRLQSITNNYSNADGGKFKGGFKINSVLGEKNNPLQMRNAENIVFIGTSLKGKRKSNLIP